MKEEVKIVLGIIGVVAILKVLKHVRLPKAYTVDEYNALNNTNAE